MSFGQGPKPLLRDIYLNTKVCLAEDNLDVSHEQSVRFEFPLEHLNVVPILFQTNFMLPIWIMIITVLLIVFLIAADAYQGVTRGYRDLFFVGFICVTG
jgi:ABC-type multidrug transport system permease subunit